MRSFVLTTAAVLVVIGIGIGALAASGQPGDRSSAATRAGICGEIASVNALTVSRRDVFVQDQTSFSFPAVVIVSSAASAQRAARLLCALPLMPAGRLYLCPVDVGPSYRFQFVTGPRSADVSLDVSGCEGVSGALAPRWVSGSASLWALLGAVLGLRDASHATFLGTMHVPSS